MTSSTSSHSPLPYPRTPFASLVMPLPIPVHPKCSKSTRICTHTLALECTVVLIHHTTSPSDVHNLCLTNFILPILVSHVPCLCSTPKYTPWDFRADLVVSSTRFLARTLFAALSTVSLQTQACCFSVLCDFEPRQQESHVLRDPRQLECKILSFELRIVLTLPFPSFRGSQSKLIIRGPPFIARKSLHDSTELVSSGGLCDFTTLSRTLAQFLEATP